MKNKETIVTKPIVQKQGAVALFDVLGYQTLLSNNSVKKAVELTRKNLLALPQTFIQSVCNSLDLDPKGILNVHIHDIEWAIFSDTIIISLEFPSQRFPFPSKASRQLIKKWNKYFVTHCQWIIFLNACAVIMRQLFIAGLPLRGAIHYGNYFIDGQCFAGKPIVAAYQDANLQNWSGCIVDQYIEQTFKEILRYSDADKPSARWILLDYPVPLKSGRIITRSVINWVWLRNSPIVRKIRKDSDRFVRESFSAHRKIITGDVEKKVNNTAVFVRHVTEGKAFVS